MAEEQKKQASLSVEENLFVKSFIKRLSELDEENKKLRLNNGAMKMVLEKEGYEIVEEFNGIGFRHKGKKASEPYVSDDPNYKKVSLGILEYVKVDTDQYCLCLICDKRVGRGITQIKTTFCKLDCALMYQSTFVSALDEIKRKHNIGN